MRRLHKNWDFQSKHLLSVLVDVGFVLVRAAALLVRGLFNSR